MLYLFVNYIVGVVNGDIKRLLKGTEPQNWFTELSVIGLQTSNRLKTQSC